MSNENEGHENGEIREPAKVLAALERAKADAKQFREERDAARGELDGLRGAKESNDALKGRLVASEARLALLAQGIKDTDRVVKYLNLDDATINESGEVEGLADKIEQAKKDLPELFDPKRRVGGGADLFTHSESKPLSDSERQVAQLLS